MKDLLCIMLIAVLFNHLGLADTVTFHTKRNVLINCSKCLTFWSTLGYSLLVLKWGIILAFLAAFSCTYCALWTELVLNVFNYFYQKTYGKIYSETDKANADSTDKMP